MDDENKKVVQSKKPLFVLSKGKKHYISIGNADIYDILMTMNDNLTKENDSCNFCILSLLDSKPKCIFNNKNECDCDRCIQRWIISNE